MDIINQNFFIRSENNISFVIDNQTYLIDKSHCNFEAIIPELFKQEINWKKVKELVDVRLALLNYFNGYLTIEENKFYYKWRGKKLELTEENPLVERILRYWKNGRDVDYLINFLGNLVQNPLKSAINELFLFLEANDIELTEDGHFLAYKAVRDDFTDCYTGTFDNSPGKIVKMPRRKVEFNRERTCSTGLHFCSQSYLNCYGPGNRIICVKINPKDVVSIPSDYNNAKGRCCKYEVLKEIERDTNLSDLIDYDYDNEEEEDIEETEYFNPVFATVAEARKNANRYIGWSCFVKGKGTKDLYVKYSFKGGTQNKHLTKD